MKKKLESELISIAHRILKLKDNTTLPQLQQEARLLYEKLTILSFAESHFLGPQPTIGQIKEVLDQEEPETTLEERIKAIVDSQPDLVKEQPQKELFSTPEKTQDDESDKEPLSELDNKQELIIEKINARVTEDLFVPASDEATASKIDIRPEDKSTFVKHLFDDNVSDYNRVLSQLNTFNSKDEVSDFVTSIIKPDYNNWVGKEKYEKSFMDTILQKFED